MAANVTSSNGYRGTSIESVLRRGRILSDHDGGRIGADVQGLEAASVSGRFKEAADAIEGWAGPNHPQLTDLPHVSTSVKLYRDDAAFAFLQYGRIHGLTPPNYPAWQGVRSQPGHVGLRYYLADNLHDANGRPAGAAFSLLDSVGEVIQGPRPYSFGVTMRTFYIPFCGLEEDPSAVTDPYIDHVNTDESITFEGMCSESGSGSSSGSGRVFGQYQIKFFGSHVTRWFDTRSGPRCSGAHVLGAISEPGWVEQGLVPVGTSISGDLILGTVASTIYWAIYEKLAATGKDSFMNILPVHGS